MAGARRKGLRNNLFYGCFLASGLGALAIVAFFWGAFEVTVAHLRSVVLAAVPLFVFDAAFQYYMNERLLKNAFQWLDEKEETGTEPSVETALYAQSEMLKFPFLGSAVSMGLWVFTALFVVAMLGLIGNIFSGRHLLIMFIAILSGGLVAAIFQFFIYKVIFHRKCHDIYEVSTGVLDHPEYFIRINYRTKLIVSYLVLITVALLFATVMGQSRAAGALYNRQTQLLRPVSSEMHQMREAGESEEEITIYLTRISSYYGQSVFVFDEKGEILYGKPPEEITPEILTGFLKEYESIITKMLRWNSGYFSRNLPRSSDVLVWLPAGENVWISSVYPLEAAKSAMGNSASVFLLLVLIYIGVAWYMARLAANDIGAPLRRVLALSREIAKGDLRRDSALLSEDEVAELSKGLGDMVNGLRSLIARVGRSVEQVDEASESIVKSQQDVSDGTNQQARVVEDSTLAVQSLQEVVSDVSDNIEVMATNSQESSKVIFEMEKLSREVGDNIVELSISVESTTSAIYEMNATIGEINTNVEALSAASEETAASMLQMDRAIKEVENRTKQTLELSQNVSADASEGVKSVQSTIEGIGRIEEGVREATEVINKLGEFAEHIGEIIAVITDIADQTNLLALNAAIIAAQAGERGRGFAVVADAIKKLSDRTTSSAKEISDLIASVQGEAQKAVSVMNRESQNVEDGVNLAFQAGQALEKIQRSATSSAEMVDLIAKATEEQATNTRRVTAAVESIAERVAQIASSIHDQSRGAEQIKIAAEEMKEIAPVVRAKAQKQLESGKQVTMAMESITEMISYVQKSQDRQGEQAEKIMGAMNQIKSVCQGNVDAVTKLDDTVTALSRQSTSLKEEVRRFKLPHEDLDLDFEEE